MTQYGFNSYFGIPPSFIEVSIRENVVYFFQLSLAFLGLISWWVWILFSLIIFFIFFLNDSFREFFSLGIIVVFFSFLIIFLLFSHTFGKMIAANTSNFYSIPETCLEDIGNSEDSLYIIPVFQNDKAIIIPLDKDKKMQGGFIVKNLSDINCKIEKKEIGNVVK